MLTDVYLPNCCPDPAVDPAVEVVVEVVVDVAEDWVVNLGAQGFGRGSVFSLPDWEVPDPGEMKNAYNQKISA